MIVDKKNLRIGIPEMVMTALTLLYVIGIRTWFPVCAVMSDTVMPCHWAGEALKALSVLMLVLSAVHMLIPDQKMKLGMDIPLIGIDLLTVFLPGHVIRICAGAEMTCRSTTHPWTVAFCVVWVLAILADGLLIYSNMTKQRHQRPQRSGT